MRRTADIMLWIALTLWLSLALAGGFAAMAVFPAARELPISMEGYEPFLAAEPALGRQLVAGYLVERVFDAANGPRLALAAVTALALLLQLGAAVRPSFAKLRLAALAVAGLSLAVSVLHALPAFRAKDAEYRSLAAQRDTIARAIEAKPALDAAHAFASRVASAEVLALVALVALSAAAQGAPRRA